MAAAVILFKTAIGALFLFWLIAVLLMLQKAAANNLLSVRESGLLFLKALFVMLFVIIILII